MKSKITGNESNLYLDANTYLSFYHYTVDDLEQLKKLTVLVEARKVLIHLPTQTKDEVRRNRDIKFAEMMKTFKEDKIGAALPQLCNEYPELLSNIKRLTSEYKRVKETLINQMLSDFEDEKFKADQMISDLFRTANKIEETSTILNAAKERYLRGNPPGKNKSYGDAIIWECLIAEIQTNKDLYFISGDGDYKSAVGKDRFSPFLLEEWLTKKNGSVFFYTRLSDFFVQHFPEIKLAEESRKELLIQAFANSHSFAETRRVLRILNDISNFSDSQVVEIAKSAVSNDQIYSIANDADIEKYLLKILTGRQQLFDINLAAQLSALIGLQKLNINDAI